MVRRIIVLLVFTYAAPLMAQQAPAKVTPAAMQLFESDWVLMNWALKYYDSNRDIVLQPDEAQTAADAFRNLADADHDGRVTPQEYRAARAAILTHE